jgi:hypothetical protein
MLCKYFTKLFWYTHRSESGFNGCPKADLIHWRHR